MKAGLNMDQTTTLACTHFQQWLFCYKSRICFILYIKYWIIYKKRKEKKGGKLPVLLCILTRQDYVKDPPRPPPFPVLIFSLPLLPLSVSMAISALPSLGHRGVVSGEAGFNHPFGHNQQIIKGLLLSFSLVLNGFCDFLGNRPGD